jgi:hypothetical protein
MKLQNLPCCNIWGNKSCSPKISKKERSDVGTCHLIKRGVGCWRWLAGGTHGRGSGSEGTLG